MAYQAVSIPRFYINALEWLMTIKAITVSDGNILGKAGNDIPAHFFYTLPVNPILWDNFTKESNEIDIDNFKTVFGKNLFLAILGHNHNTAENSPNLYFKNQPISFNGIVNDETGEEVISEYDGFTIGEINESEPQDFHYENVNNIGSLIFGTYYDMKNAPNLSLTMSRDYGQSKEFTTYNGSSMSNTMANKPPSWGSSLGAWELSTGSGVNQALSRSGRRSWDLKFSFIDDHNLWGSNQALGQTRVDLDDGTTDDDTNDNNAQGNFKYNLLTDDSFFSQVWNKTLGGTLEFVFNPSGGGSNPNNNPDMFAICRFKENSLKATQSAFNVYDISVSIEEVW